ncbi:uncharacterized protein [Temnothorax nylanderi]|uniref:uncharacterized protein n=1 Tax=Temnothorax nylanderi TaxID=102681 RepID=UPI003A8398FE
MEAEKEKVIMNKGRTGSAGSLLACIQIRKGREIEEKLTAKAEEELLENFNALKKMNRSLTDKIKKDKEGKENTTTEEMFKEILRRMEEQDKERKKDKEVIQDIIKGLVEEFKRREEEWGMQKNAIEKRLKSLEEKVEKTGLNGKEGKEEGVLIEKRKEIRENLEMKERRRRNNIIVKEATGGNETERKEKVEKLVEEINKTKVAIEEVHDIGYGGNKMIMLKYRNWESKREIMRTRKELGKKFDSFLDDDLTKMERQIQKEIRKRAKEEREAGKKTTIGYQKMWVDGKELIWNESEGYLEERSGWQKKWKGEEGWRRSGLREREKRRESCGKEEVATEGKATEQTGVAATCATDGQQDRGIEDDRTDRCRRSVCNG